MQVPYIVWPGSAVQVPEVHDGEPAGLQNGRQMPGGDEPTHWSPRTHALMPLHDSPLVAVPAGMQPGGEFEA